jgi:hypothetical protein
MGGMGVVRLGHLCLRSRQGSGEHMFMKTGEWRCIRPLSSLRWGDFYCTIVSMNQLPEAKRATLIKFNGMDDGDTEM